MCWPLILAMAATPSLHADDFSAFMKPLFDAKCVKCHGKNGKVKGKVNLLTVRTSKQFLTQPKMIKELIEVIDANDMPPEKEPPLAKATRQKLLLGLKKTLLEATLGKQSKAVPYRRLNRFQYNNAIKDLFKLNRDVFHLPEKLMTRDPKNNYFDPKIGKMPDRVDVASHSLKKEGGFKEVRPFPQDLRALHGFDNQANQLSLSPLLLEAFLRLSVSIVKSPDFNANTVGIWNDFFVGTNGSRTDLQRKLKPFLTKAFRSTVDAATLKRYVDYTLAQQKKGLSYTDAMKKVTSAALSSPLFLYRYQGATTQDKSFALASNLSFFLWGSGPDEQLLADAAAGRLSTTAGLNKAIDRMLADRKMERFADSFPAQWMQLETILAVAPDPKKNRLFTLDKNYPASLQMVLEPLLLFDAVYLENRPLAELIAPTFSYRSDFLKKWYGLSPRQLVATDASEQKKREAKRKTLEAQLAKSKVELEALLKPVKSRIFAARRRKTGKQSVDLKPFAAWEFDGNLKSSNPAMELRPHGKISFDQGSVVLKKAYLESPKLPAELKAKTMEVRFKLINTKQRGGGVMTIQGNGDFFDAIVYGERKPQHWISGSNGHRRTQDFPESFAESHSNKTIHLIMTYQADGTTTLYRNGKPYGKPYKKGAATFSKGQTSVLFGLRHLPPGGNKFLAITIDKARLYNRALTAKEAAAAYSGIDNTISNEELDKSLSAFQKKKKQALEKSIGETEFELTKYPSPQQLKEKAKQNQKSLENDFRRVLRGRNYQRVANTDPRFGGIITNAAVLSMHSLPYRTRPIGRGAWLVEVVFNDPPPPPPNDVPPLNENAQKNLTIREKFVQHRKNPSCAGCHSRLDPLGFALENFDVTGKWRDKYANGKPVDSGGMLMKKYKFTNPVQFKESLIKEKKRFAKAFTGHLMRFALSRELDPGDTLVVDDIVKNTEKDDFKIKSIIRQVILSKPFLQTN